MVSPEDQFLYNSSLVGDDAAEEVGVHSERLVAYHDTAAAHHPTLQLGRHLKRITAGKRSVKQLTECYTGPIGYIKTPVRVTIFLQ